jgi:hypothetical protein
MGALVEGRLPNPQACRLVNGPANGRQGTDFQQFLLAQWTPCSSYKQNQCSTSNPGESSLFYHPDLGTCLLETLMAFFQGAHVI